MLTNAGTWNKIYNLEFLIQNDIKFANTNYAEDASFVYQTLCSISSIYLSNEILYKYSDPDTNPCSNVNKASSTWEQLFVAMEKVWEKIMLLPNKKQIILCESFINSMIGHIRYAQSRVNTNVEKEYIAKTGFKWISEKQLELEHNYRNS